MLTFADKFVWFVVMFGLYRSWMFYWLTYAEILVFKVIYLHNFSRVASMNEYFLTNFITYFNVLIILIWEHPHMTSDKFGPFLTYLPTLVR